jgi:precorrin-6Y C5,15-methyltransferase (decarboxylating)
MARPAGREGDILGTVLYNKKVFLLTGGSRTPSEICRVLNEYGLGSLKVSVGENLSYDDEKNYDGSGLRSGENRLPP